MKYLVIEFLVLLGLIVAALPATASDCHKVEYQYYAAGYYGGKYYAAGYYPVQRQKVVFIELFNLPVYSVGLDPAGELKDEIKKLRQEIQQLKTAGGERDVRNLATKILQVNCIKCHEGEKPDKDFRIFTAPGVVDANLDWFKVWERTDDGSMPPKPREPLANDDVRILKDRFKLSKKGG